MTAPLSISGFVLAGGESRRMGQNKALLLYYGAPLLERVASQVRQAAGSVTILGDPQIYAAFGMPIVPDFHRNCGPIGGLHAALTSMNTERCLLVACDLPNISAEFLRQLVDHSSETLCVAAEEADGLQPLCAVYHRDCLPAVEACIAEGQFRMRTLASRMNAKGIPVDASLMRNVNTPEQWRQVVEAK